MEARLREFNKLKNNLLDIDCNAEGMDVRCMHELLNDAEKEQRFRISAKKNWNSTDINWSPLWLRDESNRLKRKDKSQPKSVALTTNTSTNKSSRWQRVEYGRVQNNCSTIASKNGRMSTKQKGSYQAAGRPVAAFSPSEQLQDNNDSNFFNDDCNLTLRNSTKSKSAYWRPLWIRDEVRRLTRKNWTTDFDEDVDRSLSANSCALTEEPYVSNTTLKCDDVDRSQTISFDNFLSDDSFDHSLHYSFDNQNNSFNRNYLSTLYEMEDECID